jgi:hypothetical protein
MIKLKTGVTPRNLYIMAAVANVAASLPHDVVITAGTDGQHKKGSKHYSYEALDIRSKNFPDLASKQAFIKAVMNRLGSDYDGFLELPNTPNEHFHIEYDPKP